MTRGQTVIDQKVSNEEAIEFKLQLQPLFGQRLYRYVAQRLVGCKTGFAWIYDHQASNRAKIPQSQLSKVQSDLHQAGLLEIFPGKIQSKYSLVTADSYKDDN
jgi:hypothetical protein